MDQALAHIPGLRRYARLLTGDSVRADDLVQDTLERACRKWSLWRPGPGGTGLRGWLLSLMHNLYLNQVRDEGREWNHEELSEALEPAHDPFLRAPERLDLERALQVLAPQQREALLLVTVEELTYGEAATVLGVPAGTVMSRLSRARENLRKLMAGEARLAKPAALKIVR